MKKPTCKSKKWNVIHIRRLEHRRTRKNKDRRRAINKTRLKNREGTHAAITITCPVDFSLSSNFEGVVEVLEKIRTQSQRQRNEQVYIDFRNIRKLSPAAALILAAELYRWNKLPCKGRLAPVDVSEWDDHVYDLLDGMGFFDLLQVNNPRTNNQGRNIRYVKFRTGKRADGEAIDLLRKENLEPIVGEVPGKHYLYAAVTEAMTNVVHHAYESKSFTTQANWWLSASYDSNNREVTIMIYDQGVGIPKTLPRKFSERIKNIFAANHAEMIEVAHDLSRSKSGEKYRGYGLERDVRGYLEKLSCPGHYRVVSLQGEYIFGRCNDGTMRSEKIKHNRALRGTLIEWKLFLA